MHARERRRLFGLGLAATAALGTLAIRPSGPLLAFTAADGDGRLAGRIVGDDGGPVAGAVVTITSAELDDGDASLVTDDDGRFGLDRLRPGLYDVAVEREGYKSGLLGGLRVDGAATARADLVLERRAPGDGGY